MNKANDMDQDRVFYELDMERMYEDSSWRLDEINSDLSAVAEQDRQFEIDQSYQEFLDAILGDVACFEYD